MKKFFGILFIVLLLNATFSSQTIHASDGNYSYKYDKNNRVIGILKNGVQIIEFLYDKNGNLLGKKAVK